jgi:hypothetical protein
MSDESSVRNAVCTWASRNTCLLLRLSGVSEAHSDLDAQLTYVSRLNQSIKEQIAELETLKEELETRFKTHKGFRDSIASRFIYRTPHAQDIFETEAMKAEQEYFALLGAQSKAQERLAKFESDYKEAVEAQGPLEKAVKEHDEICNNIDQLYEKLFGGPTPGFPHEDEREEAFNKSKAENDARKERIRKSREAVRLLNLANERLPQAQKHLDNAQKLAKEMWVFFDDTFNSLRLSNKRLTEAMAAINATDMDLPTLPPEILSAKEALALQFETAKLNPDALPSRDVVLSAIASAQDILSEAEPNLKELIEVAKQEEKSALSDINRTAKEVEYARQELQLVRQEIFEQVAGFGYSAPAYKYCEPAPEYSTTLNKGQEPEPAIYTEREGSSRDVDSWLEPPEYVNGGADTDSENMPMGRDVVV